MATKADIEEINFKLDHIASVLEWVSSETVDCSRIAAYWERVLAEYEKRTGALETRA